MTEIIASVEKVLNSRCSSDTGPNKSHFGTFTKHHLNKDTIKNIFRCLNIPRFSDGKLLKWLEDDYLFLGFRNPKDTKTQRLLHIESGMQHQAVYLAATAQAVGACLHNQGINGTEDKEKTTTARQLIMEIVNPYESGKFVTVAPGPQNRFVKGKNLTEPLRDSNSECLKQLPNLKASRKSGSSALEEDTSQLLWAARGRTPHCIKMQKWDHMWGLTIPTWGGAQNNASVYLLKDAKLYRYINCTKDPSFMNKSYSKKPKLPMGNPTHDIEFVSDLKLGSQTGGYEQAILLCQNEETGRSLWEVGYMLENLLLQAASLDISYQTKIFSTDEVSEINKWGVSGAVASVFI